jgi:hypothetical protein
VDPAPPPPGDRQRTFDLAVGLGLVRWTDDEATVQRLHPTASVLPAGHGRHPVTGEAIVGSPHLRVPDFLTPWSGLTLRAALRFDGMGVTSVDIMFFRDDVPRVARWLAETLGLGPAHDQTTAQEVIPGVGTIERGSGSLIRLGGDRLPPSPLGPQAIDPDVGVFSAAPVDDAVHYGIAELRLVIEVLSRSTWRADLGVGEGDDVDRWSSYLASGVRELWIVNVGVDEAPLPPRSGLFLGNAGEAWRPLDGRDLVVGPPAVHGLGPVTGGVVRSGALEGEVDVGALLAGL